jgi:cytidine deaminase
MAAFFNLLSYGENMYKDSYERGTIHAEHNAVQKLPTLPRKSRLKKIDLLVIRTSRVGTLGNSKPCVHCLTILKTKLPEKGYSLQKVYYSEAGGNIVSTSFVKLLESEEGHCSRFYKERLYQVK